MVPMKINQRRAGESCSLDRYPEQCELLTDYNQSHRGHEQKQTAGEARLADIREKKALLEIGMGLAWLLTQGPNRVKTGRQEQKTGERPEQLSQRVLREPSAQRRCRRDDPVGWPAASTPVSVLK